MVIRTTVVMATLMIVIIEIKRVILIVEMVIKIIIVVKTVISILIRTVKAKSCKPLSQTELSSVGIYEIGLPWNKFKQLYWIRQGHQFLVQTTLVVLWCADQGPKMVPKIVCSGMS